MVIATSSGSIHRKVNIHSNVSVRDMLEEHRLPRYRRSTLLFDGSIMSDDDLDLTVGKAVKKFGADDLKRHSLIEVMICYNAG